MKKKINKEIREYTEGIFFGLSMRQTCYSIVACIIAVILYFYTIEYLGSELTSWLCMIGALPFVAIGFIKFQNMHFEKVIVVAMYSIILKRRQLTVKAENYYMEIMSPIFALKKKEELRKDDKKFKKDRETKQRKDKNT